MGKQIIFYGFANSPAEESDGLDCLLVVALLAVLLVTKDLPANNLFSFNELVGGKGRVSSEILQEVNKIKSELNGRLPPIL